MHKSITIRDPVHDYIYITPIERDIIDQPEFQRLRFILQNSSAYLTYPSNNVSRFLHSLGVMHVAGELLLNGFKHAKQSDLQDFLEKIKEFVNDRILRDQWSCEELKKGWGEVLGNVANFSHHPSCGSSLIPSEEQLLYINVLWQSTRLAALIHDVGHFPLSHIFEYAFADFFTFVKGTSKAFADEYTKRFREFRANIPSDVQKELPDSNCLVIDLLREYPLHEMWGSILFHKWLPTNISDTSKRAFYNVVSYLAKVISLVNPEETRSGQDDSLQIFRCLHALVAGELDADRLDYCVRDPQASGLELGAIDVARIIRSMVLVREDQKFQIIPEAHAISALESFFHQRYLVYRYLVYHHNVVRLDGVAQEIVFRLLEEAGKTTIGQRGGLDDLIDQFGLWVREPSKVDGNDGFHFLGRGGFEFYDDAWLRTLMSQCLLHLRSTSNLTNGLKEISLLLETFLYRKTDNIVSMWKRETDYLSTLKNVLDLLREDESFPWGHQEEFVLDTVQTVLSPRAETPPLLDLVIKPIKEELSGLGVIFVYRIMKPKVPSIRKVRNGSGSSSSVLRVLVNGKPEDCCAASSYLSLLAGANHSPTIFFAFIKEGLKAADMEGDREKCREIVRRHLANYAKDKLYDCMI